MKIVRISLLAMLLFIVSVFPASAATSSLDLSFEANLDKDNEFNYSFDAWQSPRAEDETYYLFLPSTVANDKIVITFDGSLKFDGAVVKNGEEIVAPSEGLHDIVCNGEHYVLDVYYSSDIPAIYIDTQSGNLAGVYSDKNHKEPGNITVIDGTEILYNGGLDYIKGRGNSTWYYAKKPFNIKLDEKAGFFGMEENKSWSLLANYVDVTGVKNKLCLDLASRAGINYVPESKNVDLYINGEYYGLYSLIEKVEVDEGRVEIADLEKMNEKANPDIDVEECEHKGEIYNYIPGTAKYVDIPNNPDDITGGYILEYDFWERYYAEISGFMTDHMRAIVIKSPEYASKEEAEYIMNYFMEFENAVKDADGISSEGKHFSEYADMDSLAKIYLLNEFAKNHDAGLSSTYFYKDSGDIMYAGPAWDFDLSLGRIGERSGISLSSPEGFVSSAVQRTEDDRMVIYGLLNQRPEFRKAVEKQWTEIFSMETKEMLKQFDALSKEVEKSARMNANKWFNPGEYNSSDEWYEDEITKTRQFIENRSIYMDDVISENSSCIYYEPNGADGEMIDINWYKDGDIAVIKPSSFIYDGEKEFLGWNTREDGRGANYMPGEEIEVKKDIILYAQWNQPSAIDKMFSFVASMFK